ncbi:MAG: patatin-like phospholipase family protein [Alphaproteobacteria bacterium]|nr:patatin-like phospholipase family protein [Alphaproteobacteria bacterium]
MTYKILSLDGGGTWALIQACALADLFPGQAGHEILGNFDLAIGTSGGAITLAGLLKNLKPEDIRDLFLVESNRRKIFQRTNLVEYLIDKSLGIGPKWDTQAKLDGLTEILDSGNTPRIAGMRFSALSGLVEAATDKKTQIIITGFEYDLNREAFFSSLPSKLANLPGFEPTLAGAVHASSNAPVNYFDGPAIVTCSQGSAPRRFWDGAIGGYNNPVFHGVIEALSSGVAPKDVVALSIGTGTVWQPLGKPRTGESKVLFRQAKDPSTLGDITVLAESILDDPPDAATLNAHLVTSAPADKPRIIRMSPWIAPWQPDGTWRLPDGFANFRNKDTPPGLLIATDVFSALSAMPMDAVDDDDVNLIAGLAEQWIAGAIGNQPIQCDLATGACRIGHDAYPKARSAWNDLTAPPIAGTSG